MLWQFLASSRLCGNKIEWFYDAGGSKLRKAVYNNSALSYIKDYVSGFVYTDNNLEFFFMDEGRVTNNSGTLEYAYDIKDHPSTVLRTGLGNVRVTVKENGTLAQADHYYPFGLKMAMIGYVGPNENKFTYNGKELEDDFNLNWYHYGARYYDPQLGRWHVVDPVDEFLSPYIYVGNNPIMFIDPDGMKHEISIEEYDFRLMHDLWDVDPTLNSEFDLYIPESFINIIDFAEEYNLSRVSDKYLDALFTTRANLTRDLIIHNAESWLGVPYKSPWISNNPRKGVDCSRLAWMVYGESGLGYNYRNTLSLYHLGDFSEVSYPQRGDLILWNGHVGIYNPEKGEKYFLSATTSKGVRYWYPTFWDNNDGLRTYLQHNFFNNTR